MLVLRRSEELSFGDVLSPGSSAGEQAHGELAFKRLGNGKRGYLSRHCLPIFDTGQPLGVLLRVGAQIITQDFNFALDRKFKVLFSQVFRSRCRSAPELGFLVIGTESGDLGQKIPIRLQLQLTSQRCG